MCTSNLDEGTVFYHFIIIIYFIWLICNLSLFYTEIIIGISAEELRVTCFRLNLFYPLRHFNLRRTFVIRHKSRRISRNTFPLVYFGLDLVFVVPEAGTEGLRVTDRMLITKLRNSVRDVTDTVSLSFLFKRCRCERVWSDKTDRVVEARCRCTLWLCRSSVLFSRHGRVRRCFLHRPCLGQ